MQLKEFIKETLTEITMGVIEAQTHVDGKHGVDERNKPIISPLITIQRVREIGIDPYQMVEFDVAVTVESETEMGGGVMVVGSGAKGMKKDSTVTASRIQFKVPIRLPTIEDKLYMADVSEEERRLLEEDKNNIYIR